MLPQSPSLPLNVRYTQRLNINPRGNKVFQTRTTSVVEKGAILLGCNKFQEVFWAP